MKIKSYINNLSTAQKISYSIMIICGILLLAMTIPTLTKQKNIDVNPATNVWSGNIAISYKEGNGSENHPYVISSGEELAYFANQLKITDYENSYFVLSNNIYLNEGAFNYTLETGLEYYLNGEQYYLDGFTNKYYLDAEREGYSLGTINIFPSLENFKGSFNGDFYTIFGLYTTDAAAEELALFTNLRGKVENLYIKNSAIYGGKTTGGVASTAENASIKNVMFDGFVINANDDFSKTNIIDLNIEDILVYSYQTENYLNVTNLPVMGSNINSITLTGNYTINNGSDSDTTIKINDNIITGGTFTIDLGSVLFQQIPIVTSTILYDYVSVNFTDLKYTINYNYGVAGGIIGISSNTLVENTINKANVYGVAISGGLVGTATNDLTIKQSYNVGDMSENSTSAGLVGTIENNTGDINITNSYNSGLSHAGLINTINKNAGVVNLTNVFNANASQSIESVIESVVNLSNGYSLNYESINELINGDFILAEKSDLQNKDGGLNFNEYLSDIDIIENVNNVWVYEDQEYPLLYLDDKLDSLIDIYVGVHTFNRYHTDLEMVTFNNNITFGIEKTNQLNPTAKIYYLIHKSSTPLTKEVLEANNEWEVFNSPIQITDESNYIIYVKAVDYTGRTSYINTGLLSLDLSAPSAKITINERDWSTFNTDPVDIYLSKPQTIKFEINDNLSGMKESKYYLSSEILTHSELQSLESDDWQECTDGLNISQTGIYIVYVKAVDNANNILYINSDYLIFDWYILDNIRLTDTEEIEENSYITDKSSITINYNYQGIAKDGLGKLNHYLLTSILLPEKTVITLIDNISKKIYEYQIPDSEDNYNYSNSCSDDSLCTKKASYPFTLFKEMGNEASASFIESNQSIENEIKENFTIIINFGQTNISVNYDNVLIYLETSNDEKTYVRTTLEDSLKPVNIYSNYAEQPTKGSLYLYSNFDGNEIIFNSDSATDINITSGLNNFTIGDINVIDTTFIGQKIGLQIKLVDAEGNLLNNDYLKHFIFKIGDNYYYPSSDNIIYIPLKNGLDETVLTLTIFTSEGNNNLQEGTYYFKISNFVSYDGYYPLKQNANVLSVPVKVTNNSVNSNHIFAVNVDSARQFINKLDEETEMIFNIVQNGFFENPSVRVALYEKKEIKALNQEYNAIDLKKYVSNNLSAHSSYVYNIPLTGAESTFKLSLVGDQFNYTSYKLVFELYDGNQKIDTIKKYFIVK